MKVTLERGDFGTFLLVAEDWRDLLIQTDWDYPATAMNLGWQPCCSLTDGTVDCPICGVAASEMITGAGEYLDKSIGESFEDPGYFA